MPIKEPLGILFGPLKTPENNQQGRRETITPTRTPSFKFRPFDIDSISPAPLNHLKINREHSDKNAQPNGPYPIRTIFIAPTKIITLKDRHPEKLQSPLAVIHKRYAMPVSWYSFVGNIPL
jgi:hypothetical protein